MTARCWCWGAPSFVMEGELPVPVRQRMEAAAGEGLRVLLLARAKGALEGESISAPLEELGLCCLSDVIRENAADTLAYFRRQGVTVKVISGDDPRTVAHIARRVGLEGWENAVDATTLGEGAALAEAAERYTIFGRGDPRAKAGAGGGHEGRRAQRGHDRRRRERHSRP